MAERKVDRGGVAPANRARGFTPRRRTDPVFIGRGTWLWNPFQRPGIAKPRALILYRAWLADLLTPRILRAAGFGRDEASALALWRERLLRALPRLVGRPLQCHCRKGDIWCHRGTLAGAAVEASR